MEFFSILGNNVALGLATALIPENLFYCALGVFLGTLAGVIPGIGTLAAMSLLFPLTFYLNPTAALVMLAGIYYGTTYGGSTTSILLNLPGTPSAAVACIDGHPMANQGRAGVALLLTTVASFVGATVGILLMMLFSPMIVTAALKFGSAEYFSLMTLGLIVAATMSNESPLKGLAMILVGIIIGLVGLDIYTGAGRFTFSLPTLYDGISIVALAMGLFGVSQIIGSIRIAESKVATIQDVSIRSMLPTLAECRQSIKPQNKSGELVIKLGPGVMPWIISTPSIMAMLAVPGIPRAIVGMNAVWSAALFADSGAARPSIAP